MSSSNTNASKPDGVTGQLCNWITKTQFSDIPSEVVERAKYLILDGIACALVGAHLPWSETAANAILKMEPEGQCSIIGWEDRKVSLLAATISNSTFIQGFELDDYHSKAPLHSNSLLLPPLLAAAESMKSGGENASETIFSGEDFLRAYIIGCEIGPRVGLALHGADLLSRGWHSGAVQGPSAACAAVSSFLGMNPAQTESAIGIACTQAARNGLFAALMAKEGYTGIQEVYEVPYGGFLSCFSQGANFEPKSLPDELISELGQRWELEGVRVKLHAAMAALHGTIDCIQNLQTEHPDLLADGRLDNIENIVTQHARAAYEHGGWIAPVDKPMSSLAAQMSIQYAAAAQLLDREVLMAQFGAEKLNRPEIRSLMAKVQPVHYPALDEKLETRFTTIVTVHFRDSSEVLQERVAAPKGISPPVSNADVVDKWRRLVRGVLDDHRRDEIETKVLGLQKLEDVTELVGLLRGEVRCPIDV